MPWLKQISAQELSFTLQTPHGDPVHVTLHTDDGLILLLVCLGALAVAALGLYSVLTVIKALRGKE